MAFERIREAHQRAAAARDLARRVSEELRTPVGALSHAIDRLRGEAERAGISIEWMDRVSSESERVVRVVEHFEGEMLADQVRSDVATS
jgi:signal transduction histidine kinase